MDKYVKNGDTVTIHFTGSLEDKTVFESSIDSKPLIFKVGNTEVIIGIDEAVIGMKEGQEKEIHISSDKAYGPIEKELIIKINKDELPKKLELKLNSELHIPNEDGDPYRVRISDITEDSVELDGNHPLAGKNLIFKIKIVEIK